MLPNDGSIWPARNKHRRYLRNLLISPHRQLRFGLYFLGAGLIFGGAMSWVLFEINAQHFTLARELGKDSMEWMDGAAQVAARSKFRIGALCTAYLWYILYSTVVYTHRVYGPLVAIKRFIGDLGEGNFAGRLQIRKKDELQDLVESLNRLAERLENGVLTQPEASVSKAG